MYQTIASANDILKKSEKLNRSDPVIRYLLGEVYFARAYSYFWLVRLFGQVPIIDNVDVDYTVKKPTFEEIYNFIEKDLNQALNLLPSSSNEARIKYVTPHRGTAKALLAEVYLTWAGYPIRNTSKYATAAKLSGEVIDSAAFFGYKLLPDLADLWNGKHEVNQESIYSLYSSGSQLDWMNHEYGTQKYLATDLYFFSPPMGYSPTAGIKFFNFFPNSYRKDLTYLNQRYYVYAPACVVDSFNPNNTYCPPPETLEYRYNSIDLCYIMYFRKYYTKFDLSKSEYVKLE